MATRESILLVLILFLSMASAQSAEYRASDICFAKENPAQNALIVFVLEPGMRVTSLRENNNWVFVTSPKNNRLSGWVQKEALILTTKETAVSHKTDSIRVLIPNPPGSAAKKDIQEPRQYHIRQAKEIAQRRIIIASAVMALLVLILLLMLRLVIRNYNKNKILQAQKKPHYPPPTIIHATPPEPKRQRPLAPPGTSFGPPAPAKPPVESPKPPPAGSAPVSPIPEPAVKTSQETSGPESPTIPKDESPKPAPTGTAPVSPKPEPAVKTTPPPQVTPSPESPTIPKVEIPEPAPTNSAPISPMPEPAVKTAPPPQETPVPESPTIPKVESPKLASTGTAPASPKPEPVVTATPPLEPEKPTIVDGIEINEDFQRALDLMENTNRCIFITGKAGTGKSTLLKLFVQKTQKKVALLALTGIAALNIGGRTIHSFFKFPRHMITDDDIKDAYEKALYQSFDAIIIDEISMVRADMLDAIDKFLRKNGRDRTKPFGGIQVIFFGDLFQLPPIAKNKDELAYLVDNFGGVYFFDAPVIKTVNPVMIQLQKVYRQKDQNFIYILDAIRTGNHNHHILDTLNERLDGRFQSASDQAITLTPKNAKAFEINKAKLDAINSKQYIFRGFLEGKFPEDNLPTDMELPLKAGAQVMFVKNDSQKRWVNGTLGKVIDLSERSIKVRITANGGGTFEVMKEKWEIYEHKYDPETKKIKINVIGSFSQIPLKLAWAITINKSQGLTFDKVVIDLDTGAFACGQTYVALSRCRTLGGIILRKRVTDGDIRVDPRVVRFMENPHAE